MGNSTKLQEYEDNDPGFLDDLEGSKKAVYKAAVWLSECGYPVTIKPTYKRPDVGKMSEYSDDGDLTITQRVEVKRRKELDFNNADDFKYSTVIVDVCHTYDNAKQKPYIYIIFNKAMTACIVVEKNTVKKWIKVKKWDRFKKRERNFYECPISEVRFFNIKEDL